MVVMSIDQFEYLNGEVDAALDAADLQAESTAYRMSHREVFDSIRRGIGNV